MQISLSQLLFAITSRIDPAMERTIIDEMLDTLPIQWVEQYVERRNVDLKAILRKMISETAIFKVNNKSIYKVSVDNLIPLIKNVREQTGWDLKKAKDFVELTLDDISNRRIPCKSFDAAKILVN